MLADLARAKGVATEYDDWQGRHVVVPADHHRGGAAALGIDASDDVAAARALAAEADRPWRRLLPPVVVCREGWTPWVPCTCPHGDHADVWVDLEDGGAPRRAPGRPLGDHPDHRRARGGRGDVRELPGDLPLGWHTLAASHDGHTVTPPLVVTPAPASQLPGPLAGRRAFGPDDAAVLASARAGPGASATWPTWPTSPAGAAHDLGADFVLVNPLHAAEPVPPMEPSPYLPTTRRFVNPLYLRVEDIPEMRLRLAPPSAARSRRSPHDAHARNTGDVIDRDAAWAAKRAALQLVFTGAPRPGRERGVSRRSASARARGCVDFATWCALAEEHGRRWRDWPEELRDPRSPAVAGVRATSIADEVDFHCWLQWVLDEQLARGAGRARGAPAWRSASMHDLAVGVHPDGADAWAPAATCCAPRRHRRRAAGPVQPASGQDWSQPPWRPDRLAELGYAPFRDMVAHRAAARRRHPGRPRHRAVPAVVDPARACAPTEGTYVRYDHEALIGILALEAHAGRRRRGRRGPRRRRAVGARLPARARHPRHVDPVVRAGRATAARCRRSTGASCAWPRSPRTTCRRRPATSPASTSAARASSGC